MRLVAESMNQFIRYNNLTAANDEPVTGVGGGWGTVQCRWSMQEEALITRCAATGPCGTNRQHKINGGLVDNWTMSCTTVSLSASVVVPRLSWLESLLDRLSECRLISLNLPGSAVSNVLRHYNSRRAVEKTTRE